MRREVRTWTLAVLSCLLLMAASARTAKADGFPEETKGPFYNYSESELRARKLARGFANVVLCPAEIPNQAFQEAYKTSPVSGAVVGAGKGILKGAKRLVIGVWEMATFYMPTKNKYQPYVEPEVVFMEYTH